MKCWKVIVQYAGVIAAFLITCALSLFEWVRKRLTMKTILRHRKVIALCVSVIVALSTTYALILPAITVSVEEAREMGGIDVGPAAEEAVAAAEDAAEEEPDAIQTEEAIETDEIAEDAADVGEAVDVPADEEEQDIPVEETAQTDEAIAEEEVVLLTGSVYAHSLNIRAEKSLEADIVGTLEDTEIVTILEDTEEAVDEDGQAVEDGWLFIRKNDGTEGYVKDEYIIVENETVEEKRPAAAFAETVGAVSVSVEAPVGAFPAGTTMTVTPVAQEEVMDAVQSVVEENIKTVSAVDITFKDPLGDEIEPYGEIKVSMSSTALVEADEQVVVHVDDEGTAAVVESQKEEEQVVFAADSFSVYVIVGTEITTEWTLTTPDGMSVTYDVTVTYGEDANIPKGSTLKVTEFDEQDEEYQKALSALTGEGEETSEEEDEPTFIDEGMEVPTYTYFTRPVIYMDDFGVKAFDISIIGPDGEEVEPEAPVEVSITLKQLPEDVERDVLEESMSVAHLKEDDAGVQVETVASADENYPGDIRVMENTAEITFSVDSFSTFTIQWTQNNTRRATVHYVDEAGNELDVSNSNFRGNNLTQSPAYLIYDIDGYEYVKTTLGSVNGTAIRPMLSYNNSRWRYTTTTGTGTASWTNFDYDTYSNRNVYVVYKPKESPTEGGTPKVEEDSEPPLDPSIHKKSDPNGDGTNTLSLSITGHTAPIKVESLADVIVIFDVSGSMNRNMAGNDISGQDSSDSAASSDHDSRLWIAYDAVSDLADNLLSNERVNSKGEKLIRMSLVSFSNTAQFVQGFTDDPATFKNAVSGLHADGGTNWESALHLANTSSQLVLDPDRATFVVFVTDGAPTFRYTRYDVSDNGFNNDISNDYYRAYGVYGQGNSDTHAYNYSAALTEATSIVGNNKNFYSIGISGSTSELETLTSLTEACGAGSDHSVIATSEEALIQAFDDIAEKITGLAGFAEINMTDGITDLSNTVMEKSSMLGVDDDFTYWKAPAPANWSTMTKEQKEAYQPSDADFVEWDPSSERCQPASYNESTGAVEWHMGPNFIPEDGCTYKVKFTVWPSQDAYDWIADLKNGTKTWNDVVAAGLDYPNGENPQIINNGNGTYSLATNRPGANTTYKAATKTGDTITTTGDPISLDFNTVEPMGLAEKEMIVRKRFSHEINDVSPLTQIEFTLYEGTEPYKKADGTPYKIKLPTVAGATPVQYEYWEDNVYIAPGLIKTISAAPGYQILESGHDYTLVEEIIEGDPYEYQFTPQIVRPMVIGTTLTYLVKMDEYHTNPDQAQEYVLDGETYYVLGPNDQALTGTNRKTSELDITKLVKDSTGSKTEEELAQETFTYKITLTVPEGADKSGIMAYEYVPRPNDTIPGTPERPRFLIFGYQGEESGSPFSEDVEKFRGIVYGGWNAQVYNMFGDGNTATFYMTLDNDEVIRLTNLPQGTQYTITEYYANVNASDVGAPSPESSQASNVAAQGYTVTVKQDGSQTAVETDTISGTITELDKRYYNQFTNTLDEHVEVELKARKHLDGYTWSGERYYINLTGGDGSPMPGASGRTRFYRSFLEGSAGDADVDGYTFGKVRFTSPGTYTYTVAEDDPDQMVDGILHDAEKTITIVVVEDTSTHTLSVESVTGDDTEWDGENNTIMTTITNSREKVILKKVDENTEQPIEGAVFELYLGREKLYFSEDYLILTREQVEEIIGMDITSDGAAAAMEQNGISSTITIGEVELNGIILDQEYTLKEISAPTGYIISNDEIKFTLKKTGEGREIDVDGANAFAEEITITITNPPGAALPKTGGPGTFLYTLSGIALIIASAIMYGFRVRRRERRLN